jgi:sec-independent protein translocase protein TatA
VFRNPMTDALVVLVVLVLIFGPKKLPQLGRGLGDGLREFKQGSLARTTAMSRKTNPHSASQPRRRVPRPRTRRSPLEP